MSCTECVSKMVRDNATKIIKSSMAKVIRLLAVLTLILEQFQSNNLMVTTEADINSMIAKELTSNPHGRQRLTHTESLSQAHRRAVGHRPGVAHHPPEHLDPVVCLHQRLDPVVCLHRRLDPAAHHRPDHLDRHLDRRVLPEEHPQRLLGQHGHQRCFRCGPY